MIVGSTLFKLDGSPYYTSEMPRSGLAATFAFQVRNVSGSPLVTVTIEHRNYDETAWSAAGAFSAISAVGTTTEDVTGIKELYRLRVEFDASNGADAAIHYFLPAPAWRPYT